ncbi:MAG: hypothetical protein LBU34_16775 [Planctomycetaceae bacterium]|jgi:hypothetical protein|nr:hypothetical protein [Planctomycetaceae bacterium]
MSFPDIPDATGVTFEKAWLLIQENAKLIQEYAKQAYEKNQQTEREFEELRKFVRQASEQQKLTDKQLDKLGNRLGEME